MSKNSGTIFGNVNRSGFGADSACRPPYPCGESPSARATARLLDDWYGTTGKGVCAECKVRRACGEY